MFFALGVVVLTMLLSRSAMRFGGILVLFSCLIVCVSGHLITSNFWVKYCLNVITQTTDFRAHHDAFPDGQIVLLTALVEGQRATVLQLPAEPKTESEAEAQERAAYVG